jgi:hypothetical protein
MLANRILFGLLGACAFACAGSDAATDAADATDAVDVVDVAAADTPRDLAGDLPAADYGDVAPGDPNVLVGSFVVSLVEAVPATTTSQATEAFTQLVGVVFDGPSPALTVWTQTASEGACRLLIPSVPFCSVSCGGSAGCVADEVCQAYPTARSVGTIVVKGLHTAAGVSEFSLDPVANGYQTVDALPFPAFTEGEAIRVETGGGDYAPFVVVSSGIAPLVLADGALALARDQALALSWTLPATAGTSTIHVKLDISHHGGSKGKIECDTDDDGSLTVAASLVTSLLDLGVAGFPTIVVARHAVGSTTIAPGRVDLEIVSDLEVTVEVPGVTSCNEDTDCSDGQTCQTDLTCK